MNHADLDKWIEIDIDSVEQNLQEINAVKDKDLLLIAVVKANAYGHGAPEIARVLQQQGVNYFAVSFLYEALQLREAGIDSNILLFAPLTTEEEIKLAAAHRLTLTIASPYDCDLLIKTSRELDVPITVHLKMETGLSRFGLSLEELAEVSHRLKSAGNIVLEGFYTHMADPSNRAFTEKQFARFTQGLKVLEANQIKVKLRHCANSAVFLKYPHMHLDAVRIGTLLSGQYPAGKFTQKLALKDPYHFKSRIISLKSVDKGACLGYKRTYRLRKKAQIAVIPVGYSDGLGLEIANRPENFWDLTKKVLKMILNYLNFNRFILQVRINNNLYPIRGKVFMQMALVEIPEGIPVKIGDEVELPIRKTLVSPGFARIYLTSNKTVMME